jgi:hypothetical protein
MMMHEPLMHLPIDQAKEVAKDMIAVIKVMIVIIAMTIEKVERVERVTTAGRTAAFMGIMTAVPWIGEDARMEGVRGSKRRQNLKFSGRRKSSQQLASILTSMMPFQCRSVEEIQSNTKLSVVFQRVS